MASYKKRNHGVDVDVVVAAREDLVAVAGGVAHETGHVGEVTGGDFRGQGVEAVVDGHRVAVLHELGGADELYIAEVYQLGLIDIGILGFDVGDGGVGGSHGHGRAGGREGVVRRNAVIR